MSNESAKFKNLSHASISFGLTRMNNRVIWAAAAGVFLIYDTLSYSNYDMIAILCVFGAAEVVLASGLLRYVGPTLLLRKHGVKIWRLWFQIHCTIFAFCCSLSVCLLLVRMPIGVYNVSAVSALIFACTVAISTFAFDLIAATAFVNVVMLPIVYTTLYLTVGTTGIAATAASSLLFFTFLGWAFHKAEVGTLMHEEIIRSQRAELLTANEALSASNLLYQDTLESIDEIFLVLNLDGICFGNTTDRASKILGLQPVGLHFSKILRLSDAETSLAHSWLKLVASDRIDFDSIAEQGPSDWHDQENGLTYRIRFFAKRSNSKLISIIMTLMDITNELLGEKEVLAANSRSNFILSASQNPQAFQHFVRDLRSLLSALKDHDPNTLNDVRFQLHTMKSKAAIFHVEVVVAGIHELETFFRDAEFDVSKSSGSVCSRATGLLSALEQFLLDEKETLEHLHFSSHDELRVTAQRIDVVKYILAPQIISSAAINQVLAHLNGKLVSELLVGASEHVSAIAGKLGKDVRLRVATSTSHVLMIAPEYQQITDALVHFFNNAVDHGIEDSVTRQKSGKTAFGTIEISVSKTQKEVVVEIRDDGKGIDVAGLRESLVRKDATLSNLSDAEVIRMIFNFGTTSRSSATVISGHGIGLSAVHDLVLRNEGRIDVETTFGRGTTFKIFLPLHTDKVALVPERVEAQLRTAS